MALAIHEEQRGKSVPSFQDIPHLGNVWHPIVGSHPIVILVCGMTLENFSSIDDSSNGPFSAHLICPDNEIPGNSLPIQQLRALVQKVALTGSTVLISGENGVGKGRVARAIHKAGSRAAGPFLRVNCTAGGEEQINRELFGADDEDRREGCLELASGGTIVLEEVSELPLRVQIRLLRVIQEGENVRPESRQTVRIDTRVIATSQRDLAECVARGTFRQDLFFRLNIFPLRVPPLRERICDLPILATAWLEQCSRRNGSNGCAEISDEALRHLMAYSWPGNVRELENALERAVILTGVGSRIEADVFGFLRPHRDLPAGGPHPGTFSSDEVAVPNEPLLTLDELEKRQILRVLEHTKQNRTRAAALLDISVRTLRNKLHRYRAEAAAEVSAPLGFSR